jgi:hypothetical protein
MAATATGHGYWMVASDGGIFAFGDAAFYGSGGTGPLPFGVIGMVPTRSGQGYWLVFGNGQVHAFGNAAPIITPPVLTNAECAGNPPGSKLLVVSISRQQLSVCDGGQLVGASAVTTGRYLAPNVNHATPTGTWHIYAKMTDRFLSGCDANGCWHDFVHYWMPFDVNIGFHDAPWQTFPFGGPQYATQGSAGCVHVPEAEMSWVYAWAPVGTTVTVHN